MKRLSVVASISLALVATLPNAAQAIPAALGYSGKLLDATGTPAQGPLDMAFRLYDGPDPSATLLFEQTFTAVDLDSGYFWVLLDNNEHGTYGLDDIAKLFDPVFIEVVVEASPLEPRQQLASVPWALASATVPGVTGTGGIGGDGDTLAQLACPDGQIPKRQGGVWGCATDNTGGAGSDTLASLSCTSGQIVVRQGITWVCGDNTGTPELLTTCNSGEVMKWSGTAWQCAADSTGAGGSVSWFDIPDAPAGLVEIPGDPIIDCVAGDVVSWDGAQWSCQGSANEADPIFSGSAASGISGGDITNWDTAFGWGDHALEGYLTSYTETDPQFSGSAASGITAGNITNWNTAVGWGNHATAGYLTSYTESDPVFSGSTASGITAGNVTNWNTAFGWGDHASAGYLTSYTESDPQVGTTTSGQVCTGTGAGVTCTTGTTSANTAGAIVQRDAAGNFSTGTITATGYNYSATRTGYASVASTDFYPELSSNGWGTTASLRYFTGPAGTVRSMAGITLPHGVTVTEMSCWVLDNSTSYQVFNIGLIDTIGNAAKCFYLSTTVAGASPTVQQLSMACNDPVDNSGQSYNIHAYFDGLCGSNCGIRGCRLTYTYTQEGR